MKKKKKKNKKKERKKGYDFNLNGPLDLENIDEVLSNYLRLFKIVYWK